MSEHYQVVCEKCGTVTGQCHCISENKKIIKKGLCEKCKSEPRKDDLVPVFQLIRTIEVVEATFLSEEAAKNYKPEEDLSIRQIWIEKPQRDQSDRPKKPDLQWFKDMNAKAGQRIQ